MKKDENWVMSRKNRNHGNKPIKEALLTIGSPQEELRIIHVTGTNGKGSTTNYLKDILMAQGYRVGTFTSPHLESHFDRIRINGDWIAQDVFQGYLERHIALIERLDLSMFEIDFLIAMEWFHDQKTAYVIVECGLGARNDVTNVIDHPVLSVITTVNFDHMNRLGNRIEQIAFEKAGIMKKGIPVIMGKIPDSARGILLKSAHRMRCPYRFVEMQSLQDSSFRFDADLYRISSLAQYQKENAAAALCCAKYLGIDIHEACVKEAIQAGTWKGRFEMISQDPVIIVDGAHNEEGIQALIKTIRSCHHPVITVFSALKDKPAQRMAHQLAAVSKEMIVTYFENERSDLHLMQQMESTCVKEDYREAIAYAKQKAEENDWIIISGSLYFVSLARAYVLGEAACKKEQR